MAALGQSLGTGFGDLLNVGFAHDGKSLASEVWLRGRCSSVAKWNRAPRGRTPVAGRRPCDPRTICDLTASSTWAEAAVVSAIILRCMDAQRPKTGASKLADNRKFFKPAPVRVKLTMPAGGFEVLDAPEGGDDALARGGAVAGVLHDLQVAALSGRFDAEEHAATDCDTALMPRPTED